MLYSLMMDMRWPFQRQPPERWGIHNTPYKKYITINSLVKPVLSILIEFNSDSLVQYFMSVYIVIDLLYKHVYIYIYILHTPYLYRSLSQIMKFLYLIIDKVINLQRFARRSAPPQQELQPSSAGNDVFACGLGAAKVRGGRRGLWKLCLAGGSNCRGAMNQLGF